MIVVSALATPRHRSVAEGAHGAGARGGLGGGAVRAAHIFKTEGLCGFQKADLHALHVSSSASTVQS